MTYYESHKSAWWHCNKQKVFSDEHAVLQRRMKDASICNKKKPAITQAYMWKIHFKYMNSPFLACTQNEKHSVRSTICSKYNFEYIFTTDFVEIPRAGENCEVGMQKNSHFHLLLWWVSASGEVIIRKMGEWVQDAERWITLLGMADRAAVKVVNRSDPCGHLKQRELQLLVHSPTNHD